MTDYRRKTAKSIRDAASQLAFDRKHPIHQNNGDEDRYASANYAMNFTKGLEHDPATGLIKEANDFRAFRQAIDNGYVDAFTTSVPSSPEKAETRKWEAPTAGLVYDLQGPDSQAVTMAPAPALGSTELAYEMAEVYELALLRDTLLTDLEDGATNANVTEAITRLNKIGYDVSGKEGRRRTTDQNGKLSPQTLFRGSSPGVAEGPYLSQFMLLGNTSVAGEFDPTDGYIQYGALRIDQRVPAALSNDFMTDWNDWLAVQNGADPQSGKAAGIFGPANTVSRQFISTPRDLATYVHYDALYEAYLNACLVLLGMGTPFDPAFDKLSGGGKLFWNSLNQENETFTRKTETHEREAGGFALWGGPHILTLVTEVATRALKAVRYQKFNTHLRLRPEALAARIEKEKEISEAHPLLGKGVAKLSDAIKATVKAVRDKNNSGTALLPMAFQEGSPMHPSYGAGHATVAGACVTILKAFFDTSAVLVSRPNDNAPNSILFSRYDAKDSPVAFVPDVSKQKLKSICPGSPLTLEGELNKLAANISIGRNMAGVHYYSDYYDSLRMGEEIAIGILEEQALCYPTDEFILTLPTFDGKTRRIGAK